MKRVFVMLMVLAFALSVASVALARGAPTKQKAFASNAVVTEQVAPVANLVPVINGYDVIENISTESRDLSIAQNTFDVDTSAQTRLSPTVDWHFINARLTSGTARSAPRLSMKR